MEKKGKEKEKERRKKGKRKVTKGGKGRKNNIKRRRNIIILLLTHHKSGEGNSNDASFLLFLNRDNITFPSCLGGREIRYFRKAYFSLFLIS